MATKTAIETIRATTHSKYHAPEYSNFQRNFWFHRFHGFSRSHGWSTLQSLVHESLRNNERLAATLYLIPGLFLASDFWSKPTLARAGQVPIHFKGHKFLFDNVIDLGIDLFCGITQTFSKHRVVQCITRAQALFGLQDKQVITDISVRIFLYQRVPGHTFFIFKNMALQSVSRKDHSQQK